MNRYIYRGKPKDNLMAEWVYGAYLKFLPYTPVPIRECVPPESDYKHLIINGTFSDWDMPRNLGYTEVDADTVGQCTGYKDKNGYDIFEKDIVKFPEYISGDSTIAEHIEVIRFEDGSFNECLINMGCQDYPSTCEVVGVSHEQV